MEHQTLNVQVLEAGREAHGQQWPIGLTPLQMVAQTLDAFRVVLLDLIEEEELGG